MSDPTGLSTIRRTAHWVRMAAAIAIVVFCGRGPAVADPFSLSLMPDPRGEFIRLCAPFMAANYAHPEAICDCLRGAIQSEIEDHQLVDALLYGVTLRGVPSIDPTWLSVEQETAVSSVMTAIARPTLECFFGNRQIKKAMTDAPLDGFPPLPPVQDLTP